MATVFLARLGGVGGFQRLVAIKRLHPHLAREYDFTQMFLDEARLAARVHHPHVVGVLEIGESDRGFYCVMEYVEGETLARILARSDQLDRPLPAAVAVQVVLDVLAGLHAAHELVDDEERPLEIVHRDVSPQNVLIGVDGSARIADFGVARAASRLTTTRAGQLKGKLSYMAPEQARGEDVDRRADVFACGIILWEALTRRRLFKATTEAETLNRVLYAEISDVLRVNADVHPALAAVVRKALERDVRRRFPTAAEFAEALETAARDADCLGSAREVAAHVEGVAGQNIGQLRDGVRSWLARRDLVRETSRPSASTPRALPSSLSLHATDRSTNIDVAMTGPESATKLEVPRPTRVGIDLTSVRPPPEAPPFSTLSTTSSPAPPGRIPSFAPTTLAASRRLHPSARRTLAWLLGAGAIFAAFGIAAFGALRPLPAAERPREVETTAARAAVSAIESAAVTPSVRSPSTTPPAAPPSSTVGRTRRGVRPPARASSTPVAANIATALRGTADDLSRNPYR